MAQTHDGSLTHLPVRGVGDSCAEPAAVRPGRTTEKSGIARHGSMPIGLRWAPALTLVAFAAPIAAGLVGTALPALGWLPSLGGHTFGLDGFARLASQPGFGTSLWVTLFTGWAATLLSVLLALGWSLSVHHKSWARRLARGVAPLLATPHSALAIGFAFLIAPSGWLLRWISPGLTGLERPPDFSTVGHASGWPLIACLLLKEVPYLMLMTLSALNQVQARHQMAAARALGYGPATAALKVVLPQVYAQLRLPIYAVLAFSLTVVDVALVLGPNHPPTLAVLAVRWFSSPDVSLYFPGAAAAMLLLVVVLASIGAWHLAEWLLKSQAVAWLHRGRRSSSLALLAAAAGRCVPPCMALAALALLGMGLWSVAEQWRYPYALPTGWTLLSWQRQAQALQGPVWATLSIGAAATVVALALALACLENEARLRGGVRAAAWRVGRPTGAAGSHFSSRIYGLLYLPLLVPQIAFMFGTQVLLVHLGLDATWVAVVWAHLVFVLPYLLLSLADPWRAFDERYTRSALSLGASRWRVFWRVKLPILLRPTLLAAAVAFAVSVGLYLPTLFAGAGRIATLTTEAVTLAGGADRRVIGVWAVVQALLPLLAYATALALPRLVQPHRRSWS